MSEARALLRQKTIALIERLGEGERDEVARRALLSLVLDYQRGAVTPYGRLCAQRAGELWPALPTDVFRFARVAAHAQAQDVVRFFTSGTTGGARGSHPLRELRLYDAAAERAARYALFPDRARMRLLVLAPSADEAPDSSLSYMLGRFVDWFGAPGSMHVWRRGALDVDALGAALRLAVQQGEPVALLGTSFAFVYAEDGLGAARFALPAGSRVMQTGGFKGRTRTLQAQEMLQLLAARYGVPEGQIVQEYGMTELSSQLYETTLRDAVLGLPARPRRLWWPGWVGVQAVDGETLRPVAEGETGLLRIEDLANLDGAAAIQTSDLAVVDGEGLRLLGRAPDAVARGCSLAVEEALGARG